MADTPTGETVTPEALENKATPVAAPPANAPDPAEFERLQKEQEKKDLRIRQLENEAAKRLEADEAAKAKELEDKEEYKTLLEQEREKREALESQIRSDEKQKELQEQSDKVLADFNDEAKALVKELGVTLTDTSDEAIQDFRTKLESAQGKIGNRRVTSNNGNQVTPTGAEPTGAELQAILKDPIKRDAYYREFKPVTAAMMNPTE